ncbi:d-amino acid oxidase [Holotrichia oblita]|uniref:D-amino acid oxidase n=1 Tax=Holotrichia oblita TaxID=644536 RepID=A0ACB9TX06_HOLOL|nr:d-amino acid oxidase [Holotrichia oblita]
METFDDLYTETGEPQHSHTLPCCNERWPNCSDIDHAMNLAKYAPLDFYKGYMLRVDYENVPVTPGIIKKWAISVIIIWVLICILMISGINRFRRLLSQINQAVLFGCLPTCLLVLYFSTHRETLEVFDSDFNNLYNITTRSTLFSPDPTWGSPSYFIRNARNRYDSTYDLRHGLSNCTHRCLRKSDALVDEVSFWNVQTAHFLRRYHEDFSEENTT